MFFLRITIIYSQLTKYLIIFSHYSTFNTLPAVCAEISGAY